MRIVRLTALLLCTCLALGGCGDTGDVEHQAYALILGVDRAGGGIELTIQIPRIGQTQSQSQEKSSGSGSDPYLVLSASGPDYSQALERLQWTAARELNLSQLKQVVVSAALASEASFRDIISEIAQTRHLYTTAAFIVCDGTARDFINGIKTVLGTRLSSDINAMFRHYTEHGYISGATFADLYYATRSVYSDPTAIVGVYASGGKGEADKPAARIISPDAPTADDSGITDAFRRYLGAAVFHDGRLVCRLNADETLGLNLISRGVDAFSCAHGGRTYHLSSLSKPGQRVRLMGDGVRIDLSVRLAAEEFIEPEVLTALEQDLADRLLNVIEKCQAFGVEPFGLAGRAAAHFATYAAWQRFDWRAHFQRAQAGVEVHIANTPA